MRDQPRSTAPPLQDFAALHPGYNLRREVGRPQTPFGIPGHGAYRFESGRWHRPCPAIPSRRFQMSRSIAVVLLVCSLVSTGSAAVRAQQQGITLEHLQRMFDGIRSKTKWNLDGPLLWGYFFGDPDTKKLHAAANELTRRGYRLVDVHQTKDQTAYVLHVEKVEHHTLESLNKRNQEFYRLAKEYQLASYDGMDVGSAP
jgi:Regulator of ribonuclease activity B